MVMIIDRIDGKVDSGVARAVTEGVGRALTDRWKAEKGTIVGQYIADS